MDLDQGGRHLAGLVLDAAGRGHHDQVADLIAPLDWHRSAAPSSSAPTMSRATGRCSTDVRMLPVKGGQFRTGQPDRDRYGRMLRYLDQAGTNAARELLAAGTARVYETEQQLARETDYAAAAHRTPHSAEAGLWGNC